MKKVLLIILFLLTIGAGVAGTLIFKFKYDESVATNTALQAQNAQIQTQLNSIGTMVTVYGVNTNCYAGTVIEETDLVPLSVPQSSLGERSITDMAELVGKAYKIDVCPGTILSRDMLMVKQDSIIRPVYTRELRLDALPVSTRVGDYIELRIMLPNGEDIPIFTHKQIKRLMDTIITIEVSEEEHAILNAAIQDASNYPSLCFIYAIKYVEPGIDTDKVAYYPVQKDMENYIKFNPNIIDPTRCINTSYREHIDEVFTIYGNSKNMSVATSYIAGLKTQFLSSLDMQTEWDRAHTDEDGNPLPEDDYPEEGDFSQKVDEAYGSLQDSIDQLGGM